MSASINKTFKAIESKYGLGDKQGLGVSQIKFLFSFIPLIKELEMPEGIDPRLKSLEFLKHIYPKKGLNAVYRNVIEDIIEFDTLGKYKDILIGNMDIDKFGYYTGVKFGDDEYLDGDFWWNIKM